jgi:hypothetical protein
MKRIVLVSTVAVGLGILAALSGCSTGGTESTPKITGDTTSSQFKTATVVFDTAMQVGMGQFLGSVDLAGLAASASGAPGSIPLSPEIAVVPVYHLASKYWYLTSSGTEYVRSRTNPDSIVDSINWTAVDSLQFRQGDSAVAKPDSSLWNELRAGCSFVAHSETRTDSLNAGRRFVVTGAPGALWNRGEVTVNANGATHALLTDLRPSNDTTAICEVQINLMGVWAGVHANLAAVSAGVACPTSGVMVENGTLAVGCAKGADSVKYSGMWSGSLSYTNGSVTAVYENPTTRWTETRSCPLARPATSIFRLGQK